MTRLLLFLTILAFAQGTVASSPSVGDEVAGEAFVSWSAVVDKVSGSGIDGLRVSAKLMFRGRTRDGRQIRGTGKLRFVGKPREALVMGQRLRGNDSLKYWATVKSVMGGDLIIVKGTAVFDLMAPGRALPAEGGVEFEAAIETHDGT